jgi:hypothetical protein
MKFAYEILILRNEGKRSHSRYVGLRCGILLKTYLEIGGYEMCAGSGSMWVPITVLDLWVPRKAKNFLTSRADYIVSQRTPEVVWLSCGAFRLPPGYCRAAGLNCWC